MENTYKKNADGSVTLTITYQSSEDLMEAETRIQEALQAVGRIAIREEIKSLDTDGSPIVVSNKRYTSRGAEKKSTKPSSEK